MSRRTKRMLVGHCRKYDPPTADIARQFHAIAAQQGAIIEVLDFWVLGSCQIIRQRTDKYGWHFSISHPKRYPTWDEIAEARYQLIPDEITAGILLPPSDEYVNLHENCFHVHQITDKPKEEPSIVVASS